MGVLVLGLRPVSAIAPEITSIPTEAFLTGFVVQQGPIPSSRPIAPLRANLSVQQGENRDLGYRLAIDYGYTLTQWDCFDGLVMNESGWKHWAKNPSSGAFGIAQALPKEKMATHGDYYLPEVQIRWMLDYVSARYKDPCTAYKFQLKNNWY